MSHRKENPNDRIGHPSNEKINAILTLLDLHYPNANCTLSFRSPLELLIATVLSAQCTDERVNQVVPALFEKYSSAKAYAETPLEELETAIKSTGFYRNKAKNIKACCQLLLERFDGEVPADMETLTSLPGIGRKTANVILGNAFGIPGLVVDTHVARVSQRLGLTHRKEPDKIERDLMEIVPRERWVKFSHQLILHGRQVCQARKPKTGICPLRPWCSHANSRPAGA